MNHFPFGAGEVHTTEALNYAACDPRRPPPSDPSVYFDYSRFTAFLHLQNEREQQVRKLYRRQGRTPQWLSLEYYTDEVLHTELSSIYGEMDKSSPMYTKIFANYKEDRLEEIGEWILEEKEMIQDLLQRGEKLVDPSYQTPPEEVIDPHSNFTPEELEAFYQVSQGVTTSVERFHLPRSLVEIPLPKSQLENLLRPHVTGILPEVLFQQCKARNDLNEGSGDHATKFVQMCLRMSPCPWIQEVPPLKSPFLYPPDTVDLLCTPRDLFRNILHKFQVLLTLSNGVLPLDVAAARFHSLFKFGLTAERLKAWGFSSVTHFFKVLLQMFEPCDALVVFSGDITISDGGGGGDTHYLIHKQKLGKFLTLNAKTKGNETGNVGQVSRKVECVPKLLPTKVPPKLPQHHKQVKTSARIPSDCMQVGDTIESVSRSFTPGRNSRKEFQCVLLNYLTPTDFYVALTANWDKLEQFQTELTATCEGLDSSSPECVQVDEKLLTQGLYVAVRHGEGGGKDYFRGEYLEKGLDGNHKIFLVDYGEFVNVPASEIRYLRKCVAHELRLQAIWCGIYNILPQEKWDRRIIDACYEMIGNTSPPFTVKFMNSIHFKGREQWFVMAMGANRKKFPDVGGALRELLPSLEVKLPSQ